MQLPSQYRPSTSEQFVGPARREAEFLEKLVTRSKGSDKAPIALLYLGKPGIGKSALSNYATQLLGGTKFTTHRFNGTSFRIENCEDLQRTVRATEMFGEYRVIQIEEVDKISTTAQVAMLTLLDDLPPGNAVIATTNCKLEQFEERFQRRFIVRNLVPPTDEDIFSLLINRWSELGQHTARQIATFACGNIGQALKDADSAIFAS